MRLLICTILLCVAALCHAANRMPDQAKIAAVAAGTLTEANASWWGFDAADSTDCLQKAIDSGVRILRIDNVGREWLTRPLRLRSHQELILSDGVTLRAKPGAFKGLNDSLLEAVETNDLIIRGEGRATIRMNKADYQNRAQYPFSEWRHCISLRSATRVRIENLTVTGSGGDGIYIGRNQGSPLRGCRDVVIKKVICDNHLRQGISVISVENLLLKDSKFIRTGGTPPAAGIDYEPNHADEMLINCVAENCDFSDNAGSGIEFFLANLTEKSQPVSICFRNCRVQGNRKNIALMATTFGLSLSRQPFTGHVTFADMELGSAAEQEVLLSGLRKEALLVEFDGLAIDNRHSGRPAIRFYGETTESVGGVNFRGVTVRNPASGNIAPLVFDPGMGAYLGRVTGSVVTLGERDERNPFDLPAWVGANQQSPEAKNFRAAQLPPLETLSPGAAAASGDTVWQPGLRQRFRYLQYAQRGQKSRVTFQVDQVNRNPQRLTVAVLDPAGRKIADLKPRANEWKCDYILDSSMTGIYQFVVDTGLNTVRINSDRASGRGYAADRELALLNTSGRLYFAVPPEAESVTIRAAGSPKEPVDLELLDPTGKVVANKDNIVAKSFVSIARPARKELEIWSIRFKCKKLFLDIASPLIPIFSESPELLLLPKQ